MGFYFSCWRKSGPSLLNSEIESRGTWVPQVPRSRSKVWVPGYLRCKRSWSIYYSNIVVLDLVVQATVPTFDGRYLGTLLDIKGLDCEWSKSDRST